MRDVLWSDLLGRHWARGIRTHRTAAKVDDRQPRREPDDGSALPHGVCGRAAPGRGHRPVARGRSRGASCWRVVAWLGTKLAVASHFVTALCLATLLCRSYG